MSKDINEYSVMKGLIDGSQKNTLDASFSISATQSRSCLCLSESNQVYILHDGCDIRKPSAPQMEYIGHVRDLSNKTTIYGYKTFNSVAVDISKKEVNLLNHVTYSTELPNYVTQEQIQNILLEPQEIQDLVSKKEHTNTGILYQSSMKISSEVLKQSNPDVKICHIADREFDCVQHFEYAVSLGDDFITRLKLSRDSNQVKPKFTKTGKISQAKKQDFEKLVAKKFAQMGECEIKEMKLKGKKYKNITCKIEWEKLKLNEKTYSVIRINLFEFGKPLFQHPMLLITNQEISSFEQALGVYKAYLLRFKIEVVFKFLKQNLGWEDFQVRDFQSIKNLLAIAFFLVGYFKELEDEFKEHEMAVFLCQLANSKGKVTIFYILEGLAKLIHFQQVLKWKNENNIADEDIEKLIQKLRNSTS